MRSDPLVDQKSAQRSPGNERLGVKTCFRAGYSLLFDHICLREADDLRQSGRQLLALLVFLAPFGHFAAVGLPFCIPRQTHFARFHELFAPL
jgi:hypothetical protein